MAGLPIPNEITEGALITPRKTQSWIFVVFSAPVTRTFYLNSRNKFFSRAETPPSAGSAYRAIH